MKILCKHATGGGPQKSLQANQQVNRIGKYLYQNIEGATEIKYTGNMCDIWFTMLYEIPLTNDPRYKRVDDTLYEMVVNINITTYQNKLRVDTIECTTEERTLGFDLFLPERLEDLASAKLMIMDKVYGRIAKAYYKYDFVGIEPKIQPVKVLKSLGDFLYDNMDGSTERRNSGRKYDIGVTILYEVPISQDSRYQRTDDKLYEMDISLNLSATDSSVKLNVVDAKGKVLLTDSFDARQLRDLSQVKNSIIDNLYNYFSEVYKDYEFIL